jgi:hypothetical protein
LKSNCSASRDCWCNHRVCRGCTRNGSG